VIKSYKTQHFHQGFSLVEVLMALAIFGLAMIGLLSLQRDSTQVSRTLYSTTTLQEEMRNAAAIITDEVQRALYVFPPCGIDSLAANTFTVQACPTTAFPTWYDPTNLNITFSRFTLGTSGVTIQRPDNSSTTWEVGVASAPILAMIVSPRNPGTGSCLASNATEKARSCYQFVAYYPVRRTAVTGTGSIERLDADPDNNNQWVLMEYRENLDDNIAAKTVTVTGVGNVIVPAIRWDEVGCTSTGYSCALGSLPTPDPDGAAQKRDTALPALTKSGAADSFALASFVSRMYDTRTQVNGNGGASAQILMVGLRPTTGFQIEYPAASIDGRGATEVRIRMQAQLFRGGVEYVVPRNDPLEIYASPRNLPPN
jgi:prepilin-type N-terminal cleavage/methylation domain-containing protein